MLKPGLAWKVGNVKNVEFRPGFLGRQGVLSDYLLHFAVPKSKSSSFAAWYLYSTHFILATPNNANEHRTPRAPAILSVLRTVLYATNTP